MYGYISIASCDSTCLHLPEASIFRATNALVAKEISLGKKGSNKKKEKKKGKLNFTLISTAKKREFTVITLTTYPVLETNYLRMPQIAYVQ